MVCITMNFDISAMLTSQSSSHENLLKRKKKIKEYKIWEDYTKSMIKNFMIVYNIFIDLICILKVKEEVEEIQKGVMALKLSAIWPVEDSEESST